MRSAESISFTAEPKLRARIDSYCEEAGCSLNAFLARAAEHYLAEWLEDKADYEDAVAALEEYERSGRKSYSAEEVFAETPVQKFLKLAWEGDETAEEILADINDRKVHSARFEADNGLFD